MIRRTPRSTCTDTPGPYTTLVRSGHAVGPAFAGDEGGAILLSHRTDRGADGTVGAAGHRGDFFLGSESLEGGDALLRDARSVFNDQLDLLAQQAAGGVDLCDGDLHPVTQGFAGLHAARR